MHTSVMSFSAEPQVADASLRVQTSTQSAPFEAVGLECIRGDRLLFSDLSLALQPGTFLQVEGLNGCGKTSLLRILCGLALPGMGEVRWQGQSIRKVRTEFMAEVAYIGHNHGIKGDLTPVENLRIVRGLGRPSLTNTIEAALHRVGLADFSNVTASTLSAGQRRRVALCRLLATRAQLWILDEPLAALDIKGTALMEDILSEHLLQGGMAVVTTHQPLSLMHGQISRLELG